MKELASNAGVVLRLAGVSKTFGGAKALDNVDFELRGGEIHALVGQNGSGKSTLIKILAGYHQADSGTARLHGKPLDLGSSPAARQANIRFVHQELGLVLSLSIIDNFALTVGYDTGAFGHVVWSRARARAAAGLRRLGYDLDPDRTVASLRPSERVGLAIARALEGPEGTLPAILILDEPTAALPRPEVSQLFSALRAVRDRGVPVLYVSHRLDEIFELADRVTVLRDGRRVVTRDVAGLDHNRLIDLVLGMEYEQHEREDEILRPSHTLPEKDRLTVRDMTGSVLRSVSFRVSQGEIVGFVGVTGSGREELIRLIGGGTRPRDGQVLIDGFAVPLGSPRDAINNGMVCMLADRLAESAVTTFSVRENLTLLDLQPFWKRRYLDVPKEREEVRRWIDELDIRPGNVEAPILTLSGGNQQKVLLGRLLRLLPKVLALDEPSQGVDVGAKAAIHHLIRQAASRNGAAILLCSTDLDEVGELCDRVLVLRDGRVACELVEGEITVERMERELLQTAFAAVGPA